VDDLGLDRLQSLNPPSTRDPDHEEPGVPAHLCHTARGYHYGLASHPGQLVGEQGGFGQQVAGVSLSCRGVTSGAKQPDGCPVGSGDPGSQFESRPIVLRATEGDHDRTAGSHLGDTSLGAHQAGYVGGCSLERCSRISSRDPLTEEGATTVHEDEVDLS